MTGLADPYVYPGAPTAEEACAGVVSEERWLDMMDRYFFSKCDPKELPYLVPLPEALQRRPSHPRHVLAQKIAELRDERAKRKAANYAKRNQP